MIVRKAFKYRLYPTRAQVEALTCTLDRCRELYNAALEERREAYRMCGVSVSMYSQQRQLPAIKTLRIEYAEINSQVLQDVIIRLDRAFQAFFRRLQAGQQPGYPRFKSRDRYDSFTCTQTGWKLCDGRLSLWNTGPMKVKWSRPLVGTNKTVTIRRDADQWYGCFSCLVDVPDSTPDVIKPAVGIDVGLEHFTTLSSGERIPNPRHLRTSAAVLARRQQALSRKPRGSKRRKKAKLLLAKAHRKIRNQRRDFHHKTARTLVNSHSLIAVEALQIANLTKRPKPKVDAEQTQVAGETVYAHNGATAKAGLNKSIHDAGWGTFIGMLHSKAAEAGCVVVAVNPAGTSQACSGCSIVVPKGLDERWHTCPQCGLSLQRDHNAARNILRLGQSRQARPA